MKNNGLASGPRFNYYRIKFLQPALRKRVIELRSEKEVLSDSNLPVIDRDKIREDLDKSLSADEHQILQEPYTFGRKSGFEWVKKASYKALTEAATRLTSSEMLIQHLAFYAMCNDQRYDDDGNDRVVPPWWNGGEIAEYFKAILDKYPCLDGEADPGDDPEILYEGYFVSDVPTRVCRHFEDGWTSSVREFWDSIDELVDTPILDEIEELIDEPVVNRFSFSMPFEGNA